MTRAKGFLLLFWIFRKGGGGLLTVGSSNVPTLSISPIKSTFFSDTSLSSDPTELAVDTVERVLVFRLGESQMPGLLLFPKEGTFPESVTSWSFVPSQTSFLSSLFNLFLEFSVTNLLSPGEDSTGTTLSPCSTEFPFPCFRANGQTAFSASISLGTWPWQLMVHPILKRKKVTKISIRLKFCGSAWLNHREVWRPLTTNKMDYERFMRSQQTIFTDMGIFIYKSLVLYCQ